MSIAPIITVALNQAAEAYGQEIAKGAVEALFNQRKINDSLREINQKLGEILKFLYQDLRDVIRTELDDAARRVRIADINASAGSVQSYIASARALKERLSSVANDSERAELQSNLNAKAAKLREIAEACLDSVSVLPQQDWYAVGHGVAISLAAYQVAAEVGSDISLAAGIKVRATRLIEKLRPWIDPTEGGSFRAVYNSLEQRYLLAGTFIYEIQDKWPAFAIAYRANDPRSDGTFILDVEGANFGRPDTQSPIGGHAATLHISLPSAEHEKWKNAWQRDDPRVRYDTPPWHMVQPLPAPAAFWDCAYSLGSLVHDFDLWMPLRRDALVTSIKGIEDIIGAAETLMQKLEV